MKFKANLKNIVLFGYHGLLVDEREKGQNFEIDIEYTYDIDILKLNDQIENTIDYMQVYDIVKVVFNQKHYKLLETLSAEITDVLKKKFSFLSCSIKIRKPEIIISDGIQYVEIDLECN